MTSAHLIPTFKKIGELLSGHLADATGIEVVNSASPPSGARSARPRTRSSPPLSSSMPPPAARPRTCRRCASPRTPKTRSTCATSRTAAGPSRSCSSPATSATAPTTSPPAARRRTPRSLPRSEKAVPDAQIELPTGGTGQRPSSTSPASARTPATSRLRHRTRGRRLHRLAAGGQ